MFSIFLCLTMAVLKVTSDGCDEEDDSPTGARVLHGKETELRDHPYIVKLRVNFKGATFKCTGFILSPKTVMTANHCFKKNNITGKYDDDNVNVIAGTEGKPTWQMRKARKVVRSPDYVYLERDDVAIIILDDALDYNDEVNRIEISLDEKALFEKMRTGAECTIIGYGISGPKNYKDGKLRKATAQLITNEECNVKWCKCIPKSCNDDFWRRNQICTFDKVVSTCKGDSGGPLICDGEVYGVHSIGLKGTECTGGRPNIFENLHVMNKVWDLLVANDYNYELARFSKFREDPNAPERKHPFLVRIQSSFKRTSSCTGILIRKNLVLTACHCVKKGDGSSIDPALVDIEVIAGVYPMTQTAEVMGIFPHASCQRRYFNSGKNSKVIFVNDVAFLILASDLRLDGTIKTIDIGDPKKEKWLLSGGECQVYGLGWKSVNPQKNEPDSSEVTVSSVFLQSELKCQPRFCNATSKDDELCTMDNYFSNGFLCGIREDVGHCFSHSGGPVVCNGKVWGVDSLDVPCRPKRCLMDGECYDLPALFHNSQAIKIVYNNLTRHQIYGPLVLGGNP